MTHAAPSAVRGSYTPTPTKSASLDSHRVLAIAGFIAAATVIAGIIAISLIPDQFNTGAPDKALTQIARQRHAEIIAGWMFTVYLAALIPFLWMVVRTLNEATRLPATIGACIITAGATIDIIGSLLLVTVGHSVAPSIGDPAVRAVGTTILSLTASIDSAFNLLLGVGLLLLARSMRASATWPRGLTNLAVVAGVVSLPVALEWYSSAAAAVQYLSGTLFLVWVIGMSVTALRRAR